MVCLAWRRWLSRLARQRLLLPALGESASPRRTSASLFGALNPEHEARKAQGVINLHNACNMFVWPGSGWGSGPGLLLALALARHGQCPLAGQQQNKLHFAASFFAQRPALCHLFFPFFPSSPLPPSFFFPLFPSLCSPLLSSSTKFAQHKLCFVRMFF